MRFRPCIDIHNGKVKQIVGGSLRDEGDYAAENFVSEMGAEHFAKLYEENGLHGGHVILLNSVDSPFYEQTKAEAVKALSATPGMLQIGGGIHAGNAAEFLAAGASHVIVTSYVFADGKIKYDRLEKLVNAVGAEHIVLDLSCRRKEDGFYVVTDRWQTFTEEKVSVELMEHLAQYCDEFLIHAVDVEGKQSGVSREIVEMLGAFTSRPVTYAGGIHSMEDLDMIETLGNGHVDFTIGSALDLFGGTIPFSDVVRRQ